MGELGYYDMGIGCSDGGCIFRDNSKGMHTNGGCRCQRDLIMLGHIGFKAVQLIWLLRKDLAATKEAK